MVSSYFYRAMALMLTVGALSKIQKIERREHARSEKFAKLLEYDDKKEKATSQQVVCYYRIEKNDTRRLQPEDIDPSLCTHLIVGYTEVRYDFMLPKTIYDLDTFNRTVALKKKNAKMKIMLSIGEKSKGGFSHMVATSNGRERFIFSLLHFLDKYKFDGVDFDWEFPAWNGANPLERFYFILLLKELRFVIEQAKRNFLVSCAVAAHVAIIDTSYDIPEMAKAIDFVNLMSYDFQMYSQNNPLTAHHSPLFSRNSDKRMNYFLNGAWAAAFWEARGMPRKKIMLGIPTHSRSYYLKSPYVHNIDAPATGPGLGKGKLTYPQVCQFLKAGATQIFDISTKVPFAYLGHNWIAYDNENSVSFKSLWVKDEGYGGVMIFNLNNDDWKGTCDNSTKFPLTRAVTKMVLV
ncbi:acidic mammalian chitinase [Nephila pilipes]|uniref:Acidic mammalian chitinase n=1 Tax=Nephila pilipes TaxID=299642 RepID=A0A8X6R9R5_NEPPI|nr:acidic mammalian chitinase [Nephila pilipes]